MNNDFAEPLLLSLAQDQTPPVGHPADGRFDYDSNQLLARRGGETHAGRAGLS